MLEIFTNPGYLAAAGALVSAPIIIHLINRMRFKRIRWAAMEFLLKAQKRMRKRLIIEQLLLLALRCLLVALVGLLVMRFVGFSFADIGSRPGLHIVVLDDTLSMGDRWKEGDRERHGFEVALSDVLLPKIAGEMSKSGGSDELILLPLSQLHLDPTYQPKKYGKLNTEANLTDFGLDLFRKYNKGAFDLKDPNILKDLQNLLTAVSIGSGSKRPLQLDPTSVHVPIMTGVKKAHEVMNAHPEHRVTLHILSDFRQSEWALPEGEAVQKLLVQMSQERNDLKIRLIDVVHPYRVKDQGGIPLSHDNVGIVDLRPGTRVAGKDMPVTFTLTLANYSSREAEVNVVIYDDATGQERLDVDFTPAMPLKIPAGSLDTKATFEMRFNPQIKPGEPYFAQISARLESAQRGKLENDGLEGDNVRHAVVEVRDKVPVLVVDGEGSRGRQDNQDTFFIRTAIMSVPGSSYEIEYGDELGGSIAAKALERADLMKYPTIFLLNVRELNPKQLANLENYVREGGGVAFFMGPQVNPQYYNKNLYKGGEGLFPAPLKDTFFPPVNEDPRKVEYTGRYQVLLREKQFASLDLFPIFGQVLKSDPKQVNRFRDCPIKRYFKVPRSDWKVEPGKVFELATLPNDAPATTYQRAALDIIRGPALEKILENPELKKYRPGLERHRRFIESVIAPTSEKTSDVLADALEAMLQDKGREKEREQYPNLTEFWSYSDPKIDTLRKDAQQLIEQARYGDPFIIASQYGKGKVIAVMTTAGKEWSDWGGGSDATLIYQPFIWEMQNWLSSQGAESNLTVGSTVNVAVDTEMFKARGSGPIKLSRFFHQAEHGKPARVLSDRSLFGQDVKGVLNFTLDKNADPGLYVSLLHFADADVRNPLASFGHVFNVDTMKEGSLARVSGDDIDRYVIRQAKDGAVSFEGPGVASDTLVSRRNDLSESPWLYLLFISVLIAEQALAVHLSFHLKGSETEGLSRARIPEATRAA